MGDYFLNMCPEMRAEQKKIEEKIQRKIDEIWEIERNEDGSVKPDCGWWKTEPGKLAKQELENKK